MFWNKIDLWMVLSLVTSPVSQCSSSRARHCRCTWRPNWSKFVDIESNRTFRRIFTFLFSRSFILNQRKTVISRFSNGSTVFSTRFRRLWFFTLRLSNHNQFGRLIFVFSNVWPVDILAKLIDFCSTVSELNHRNFFLITNCRQSARIFLIYELDSRGNFVFCFFVEKD